jgi:hypothetical protein
MYLPEVSEELVPLVVWEDHDAAGEAAVPVVLLLVVLHPPLSHCFLVHTGTPE